MTLGLYELSSTMRLREVREQEPFPLTLRLVPPGRCGQECSFPESGHEWCHHEGVGLQSKGTAPLQLESIVAVSEFFRDHFGIQRAKIGGLEPSPEYTRDLVCALKESGFGEVSLTSNGAGLREHLGSLKDAGLDRITISIPHSVPSVFYAITGRRDLQEMLDLALEAKSIGLNPVKINRILLRRYVDDVEPFVNWIDEHQLTVKLLELMWCQASSREYSQFFVSWKSLLPEWLSRTLQIRATHFPIPTRTRIAFDLAGGGAVEVNYTQPGWASSIVECRQCPLGYVCDEGYLGCGIRISPDLRFIPCVLRSELSCDLKPVLVNKDCRRQVLKSLGPVLSVGDDSPQVIA